jgi:hypothetical protein
VSADLGGRHLSEESQRPCRRLALTLRIISPQRDVRLAEWPWPPYRLCKILSERFRGIVTLPR